MSVISIIFVTSGDVAFPAAD